LTLKETFRYAALTGDFKNPMRNFMHHFMIDSNFDTELAAEEPEEYPNIPAYCYVFAACFVHYWCDVTRKIKPEWVTKQKYRFEEPVFSGGPEELLRRDTPYQFKEHNLYMRAREVMVV
jgi:hypothetical protein